MRRREFISLVGCAAAMLPLVARAQQPDRMRLIGVLMGYTESDPVGRPLIAAFRGELAKLGWNEGRNLRTELRWSGANADRATTLAKELVDLGSDAILGHTTSVTGALARETHTIPIVFVTVTDPVSSGFAESLPHPGGNMTGFTTFDPELSGKWIELLKEIAPRTVRVALLFNPTSGAPLKFQIPSIRAAASSFGIQVSAAPVHDKDEIEGVIATQAREPGGGLIMMPNPFNVINRERIIGLAGRYGVPAIYFARLFTNSGGLISYADDRTEEFRLAAGYIDRLLKGTKPGDLPVQRPTKYELSINLKTAKALGLAVPPALLARADEVIE